MKNLNSFAATGIVKSVCFSKNQNDSCVGSFLLDIESGSDKPKTTVRMNLFGNLASVFDGRIKEFQKIAVTGEVMNRLANKKDVKLTEFRCTNIELF